ncbi:MAG: hypothetical protein FJW30_23620 [Acidobacteria bacterium]|nr:hypothetical protein [Acidobacteriota bacterium]
MPGVRAQSVGLLTADKQKMPGAGEISQELRESLAALLTAKRTLAGEGRFRCCVRGGCGQCATEAECPCGEDLSLGAAPVARGSKAPREPKGVCGDCYDGWNAGEGIFAGILPNEIKLALMAEMALGMSPGEKGGSYLTGTSQTPAARPMSMLHKRVSGWSLMFHGNLWGIYTNQTGERGRDKTFGAGWVMPMASRRAFGGTFTIRSMFSIEPLTVTNGRYPLLFQTGETWKNIPVINGQHPHDFVKELGGAYQYRLGESTTLNVYAGLRGDPAIGPVAYPHRVSSSENPIAVMAHHYQDSTHIAANVVTLGVTHKILTLEASGFHGREPDENRWGIELGPINSFASRVTVTPSDRWAAQFSLARINNREATHPDRDSWRQTASITYVRPQSTGHWATSLVWGRNRDLPYTQQPNSDLLNILPRKGNGRREHIVLIPTRAQGQTYNAYTAESTWFWKNKHWIWGRAELSDKDSLLLFEEAPYVRLLEEYRYTRIKAYTSGYAYELPAVGGFLRPALGGQVQVFQVPANLSPIYGTKPVGMQVWLRLRIAPVPK